MISAVVITDNKYGISRYIDEKNSIIPNEMNFKEDKKIFKYLTTGLNIKGQQKYPINAVVMGRKTWESLPFKPLPNRINIIISTTIDYNVHAFVFRSPQEFLMSITPKIHYWIIGGSTIYKWFYNNNLLSDIYVTKVDIDCNCDIYFNYEKSLKYKTIEVKDNNLLFENTSIKFIYKSFINNEEIELLKLIEHVLKKGIRSGDRTGAGTLRTFGHRLEFNLENFPLMTTRRHSLKWIFEELMWILRGETRVDSLEKQGINIWTPNSRSEFILQQNLDIELEEGDIGKSYGYNMRIYSDEKKYDQLQNVINLLKNNPESRRIIINLWNPSNIKQSALPPCLCWYQFFVRKTDIDIYLDCQAMNRSSDIVVAGGWNITTAALLTYILAKLCNYKPGTLIWLTGDTHIYLNNCNAAEQLILRTPNIFPKLFINKNIENIEDILNLQYNDIQLINYMPLSPQIKLNMNA